MTILIDIGHPAHVHYFKNSISILQSKGHNFVITARDRKGIHYLLEYYGFPYISRGTGGSDIVSKLFYLPKALYILFKVSIKYKPSCYLSFSSSYAAICAFVLGKPHYCFDDTEHAVFEQMLYVPFSTNIFTPVDYRKDFGKKHLRFVGSMDYAYLHPRYYIPDISIYKVLGISEAEKFVLVRFVTWEASHDIGQKGLKNTDKVDCIRRLSEHVRVFISSESNLPEELIKYSIDIPFEKMHDVLFYAELFFGESGTMATEACVLGTPAIDIATSALLVGVFDQFVEEGILYIYDDYDKAIEQAVSILSKTKKNYYRSLAERMMVGKTDITKFLTDFISNTSVSAKEIESKKYYFTEET
ncbi:MAG: hypothetical protein AMXMBFR48_13100 [Ignavibacteriales bacterium]